jgi:hypothetical protein
MIQRIAACLSLIAFTVCLLVGGLEAGNSFTTTVWRALEAMGATLVVGMILGTMAKAMLEENAKMAREKSKNNASKSTGGDR